MNDANEPPDARRFGAHESAAALEDLARCEDEAGTACVLARYTALRLVVRAEASGTSDVSLAAERQAAEEYVAAAPAADRAVLEPLLRLAGPDPPAALGAALEAAATAADARSHIAGARALRSTRQRLARAHDWPPG